MLGSLKDLLVLIATIVLLAYSTNQQPWLWKQIEIARHTALTGARREWACPSIFETSACRRHNSGK